MHGQLWVNIIRKSYSTFKICLIKLNIKKIMLVIVTSLIRNLGNLEGVSRSKGSDTP